jgi:hypothetical protein
MPTGSIYYPTEYAVGLNSFLLKKTVTCSRCITFSFLHISDNLLIEISQWNLTPVSGDSDSVFTIRPASDTTVGFSKSDDNKDKFDGPGNGRGEGHVGPSGANWKFTKSSDGNYSRYGFSMFVI